MHKNVFVDRTSTTLEWDFEHDIRNRFALEGPEIVDIQPRAQIKIIAGIVSERHKISPFAFLEHVLAFNIEENRVSFLWSSREACQSFLGTIRDAMTMLGTDQTTDHFDKEGRCIASGSGDPGRTQSPFEGDESD